VTILVLVLIAAGFLGALVVLVMAVRKATIRAERRRRDALYAWTMVSGWRMYEGDVGTSWRHRLHHLPGFRIRRLVTGMVHGLPVTAADCRYETSSTDANGHTQTSEVNLAVFVAALPAGWPDIEVRPRRLGSRLLRALGRHSPVELGHPPFDQRFQVEAADPYTARTLLTPALVDAHLRGQVHGWGIHGGELLVTEAHRLTPEAVPPGADRLRRLADMLGFRG
jgi:hypothetical protein